MLSDFGAFLATWQRLAMADGSFCLPSRAAVTTTDFHTFLPTMTIAKWDTDSCMPTMLYCGTRLDAVMRRDVKENLLRGLFEPGPHIAQHVEIAMQVIRDQVGAELELQLETSSGFGFSARQLRLPLAPAEDDKPVIMSLYELPDVSEDGPQEDSVAVKGLNHRFFDPLTEVTKTAVHAAS